MPAPGTRLRTRYGPELDLPPPFTLVTLREVGDAFAHAASIAPEAGAGTLVYVGRFDLAEFAVVLEPDEPLRSARRAFYAGMAAIADALAAYAPPEKPIAFDWPGSILVDGGLVGGGRLAWPEGADEAQPAPWLVFGAMIRTVSLTDEPGLTPLVAALEDEGFDEFGAGRVVESFARHLMTAFDSWEESGFAAVARNYLPRLQPEKGARHEIDETGDLIVRWMGPGQPERRSLAAAMAAPSWLDPATGGPRA
jgi:biotin-(acetyl-CoA carboxylase) ligase